MEKRRYLI